MHERTNSVAAAEELFKRRSTRRCFAEWAKHKGFEPAAHHRLIINEIKSSLESDDEVLLLFAPPGSAKSTYVSVLLPSWYLASHPTHSILAATHNVEFAERWGRRVRNDIAADENVLGVKLSDDSKAAARWSLESGGEYYGVGAGTGISGFRANLGVGDDLFWLARGCLQRDSETEALGLVSGRLQCSLKARCQTHSDEHALA